LSEGVLLASIGAVVGVLLALLITWAQEKFHLVTIDGGTFLINYYPVKVKLGDIAVVMITVLGISIGAAVVPARKATIANLNH
jgi:lipoprotein-releasing system permease protein